MPTQNINRRTFLKSMGIMAASAYLAACSGGKWPGTIPETPAINPSGPMSSTVSIVKAETYNRKLIKQQVQAALEALGGISDIVKPGARVAIKVNLTGGTCCPAPHNVPRITSYWTHPEIVRALGELLRDAGAQKLSIVEALSTPDAYSEGGYIDVAQSIDAELIDLNTFAPYKGFALTAVGTGWLIYENFKFNPVLNEIDTFISVPKMKCHWICGVTAAMKNLVGLGPMAFYANKSDDNNRTGFHNGPSGQEDTAQRLPRVVVDINRARPIHLALVDAITTMDGGEGPWIEKLNLQAPHAILAGKNALATDAVAAAVMGFDPTAEYPNYPFLRGNSYLNIANNLGLGTNVLDKIEIKGAALADVQQRFHYE